MGAMGASRKLELEAQLKRQKALLSQVKSGALKLPDGGEKIRVKIQELEGALVQFESTQAGVKSLHENREVQEVDTGLKQGTHSSSRPIYQDSRLHNRTDGSGKHTDVLMGQTVDPATAGCTHSLQEARSEDNNGRLAGLSNSSSRFESNQAPMREEPHSEPPSNSNSNTSSDFEKALTRGELSRKADSAGPSVRQISGGGKSVRLRSGSLEPPHTTLPSEVVRETAEKVRAKMAAEVDATAEKLGQMLTIEEDGNPMEVGPTDGPVNGVRERNRAGNNGSGPQRSSPRATKFIRMQEAAELERRQAEAQREVEDRIMTRRPPLYCGPGGMDLGGGEDDLTDESEEDMSGSEED